MSLLLSSVRSKVSLFSMRFSNEDFGSRIVGAFFNFGLLGIVSHHRCVASASLRS